MAHSAFNTNRKAADLMQHCSKEVEPIEKVSIREHVFAFWLIGIRNYEDARWLVL